MRRLAQLLILIVLAVLLIPMFLPNQIDAIAEKEFDVPAGIIFEDFNNLNEFSKWEPWTSNDSLAEKEFYSPYRGKGAGYKWTSSNNSGEITILKSEANQWIEYKMVGYNLGEKSKMKVEFSPVTKSKTLVKWSISSEKLDYFSRYYTYFTSEKLNDKLEEGLMTLENSLKTASLTPEQAQSLQPEVITKESFEGLKLLVVQNTASLDEDEINTATEESFGLIYSYLVDFIKVSPNELNNPITYFEFIDTARKETKFYCGYPLTESINPGEGMQLFSIPASEALVCIHKGDYSTLSSTLSKMKEYAKLNKLKLGNPYWEEYLNDPETVKNKSELLTKIYIPIKD